MQKLAASCAVLFGLSSMVACSNGNENQKEQENKDLVKCTGIIIKMIILIMIFIRYLIYNF